MMFEIIKLRRYLMVNNNNDMTIFFTAYYWMSS